MEKLEKQRFKKTSRPRPKRQRQEAEPKNARSIPADVARAVSARDRCRCTYVSPDGRRCCAREFLHFDHIVPVANGGKSTVENLRLLCSTHNHHAACEHFGDEYMTLMARGFRPVRKRRQLDAEEPAPNRKRRQLDGEQPPVVEREDHATT